MGRVEDMKINVFERYSKFDHLLGNSSFPSVLLVKRGLVTIDVEISRQF